MLNIPNDQLGAIQRMIPGLKHPTVVPLGDSGWSSLQSVIQESRFWEIVEELEALGAEGILVLPIEKMVNPSRNK
jgi:ATP phosphoribosyltransferase